MLKTVEGIVVKETPFKENSKILSIYTKDGLISVVSKGCKNLKSPLRVISNKLSYASFTIYYNENKLSTLKEGKIINDLIHIKSDLILISYLIYLTDLVIQISKQDESPEIYDLYISTILKIEEGFNPLILSNILELKLLDYLGVSINYNECIKCGKSDDIVTISLNDGGYICKNCYDNEIVYDSKVLKIMKLYHMVDINTIKELKISDKVINDINDIISSYYDDYTGIYIKSKDFIKRNINIG